LNSVPTMWRAIASSASADPRQVWRRIRRRESGTNLRFSRSVAAMLLLTSVFISTLARGEQPPAPGTAAPPRVAEAAAPAKSARPSHLDGVSGTPIPDSLVEHFRRQGLALRPALRYPTAPDVEWILDGVDVGPACKIVTRFVRFPPGSSPAAMKASLERLSVGSVLNEREALAMFHPFARGKTSASDACVAWTPAKSAEVSARLVAAFKSYAPR